MATSLLEQVVAGNAPTIHRLTVDQFQLMLETGILHDGEPVELLDGLLVDKDRADSGDDPMVHGERHQGVVGELQDLLTPMVKALGFSLRSQLPIAISTSNQPEPDGAVMLGTPREYRGRVPSASDVLLIIEVADSSLQFDRTTKHRIYATASIPGYWIVNLQDNIIEVYSQPDATSGEYKVRQDSTVADTIPVEFAPGKKLDISVRDIVSE